MDTVLHSSSPTAARKYARNLYWQPRIFSPFSPQRLSPLKNPHSADPTPPTCLHVCEVGIPTNLNVSPNEPQTGSSNGRGGEKENRTRKTSWGISGEGKDGRKRKLNLSFSVLFPGVSLFQVSFPTWRSTDEFCVCSGSSRLTDRPLPRVDISLFQGGDENFDQTL